MRIVDWLLLRAKRSADADPADFEDRDGSRDAADDDELAEEDEMRDDEDDPTVYPLW